MDVDNMKVATSAEDSGLDSPLSSLFGRCKWFVIVNVEDGEIVDSQSIENTATNQASGAGTVAAQLIGDKGAGVLISGGIGPKAFSALEKWDIEMYEGKSGTVRENVESLLSDSLNKVDSPTGSAHRGNR